MTPSVWPRPAPGTRWFIRLPNWIGDAVMVLPALRSLPVIDQEWLGAAHPRVVDLYRASGLFTEILPATGARAPWDLGSRVRRWGPDRAIVFTEAVSGAILAWVSGASLRLGRAEGLASHLYPRALPRASRLRPHWKELLEVATAAGGNPVGSPDFKLSVDGSASERAARFLEPLSVGSPVALAPGAAFGPAKQWPLSRFVALGEELLRLGRSVVVIGGHGERSLGTRLAEIGALDLTGKTSLLEAHAVLERSRALITNDSGAMHLARAAGTRMIAVFGSSSPRWTGPEPEEGEALWLGLPCSPCFHRRCPLEGDIHLRCLEDISVGSVLEVLERNEERVG